MSDLEAVAFVWDGSAMVPLDRFRALARRQFKPGKEYSLAPWRDSSDISRGHYFACVRKGWQNLPEEWSQEFPSEKALRKWCLVQEGYATHRQIPFMDPQDKQTLIDALRDIDPYVVLKVRGHVMDVWIAMSQDKATMGHAEFQRSKDRVLGRISEMCGISIEELTKHAGHTT
jgi:hypothetical protein